MSDHHGFSTLPDQIFIDIPVRFVPLFCCQGIYAGQDMLISLIHTISREMFNGNSHITGIRAFHIGRSKVQHLLRITAKGAHIGDRVMKIIIDIHNRSKRPVQPYGSAFPAGGQTHAIAILRIICGCNSHRFTKRCSFKGKSVPSGFGIGCQKERDFCTVLQHLVGFPDILRRVRSVHQTTHTDILRQMFQYLRVITESHRAEYLTTFFFQTHILPCIFHPLFCLIGQKKRIFLHMDLCHCLLIFFLKIFSQEIRRATAPRMAVAIHNRATIWGLLCIFRIVQLPERVRSLIQHTAPVAFQFI